MTKTYKATVDGNRSNPLYGKEAFFTIKGEAELWKEEDIHEAALDVLAELEEGNEEAFRDWRNNGMSYELSICN